MARILVVDDSIFARLKICNAIKKLGHEILEAGNGREGLQVALECKPDCIISDLLMPEMDGIGFLTSLREAKLNLPVVVLTADIQETKRQECLNLGAFDFLHKPPQERELKRVIKRILGQATKEANRC